MDNKEFGEMLAALRRNKKMSQSELASELEVSVSAISKWETGVSHS